jgi:arginine decarboxylase
LRITYLPKIGEKIDLARATASTRPSRTHAYQVASTSTSTAPRATTSSYVIDKVLDKGVNLETSSAYDLEMIELLIERGRITKDATILCNGFKDERYIKGSASLANRGFNVVPIIDNMAEIHALDEVIEGKCDIGIRIAAEEAPKFEFYTSRLGIGYKDIIPFYMRNISKQKKFRLKLMHFFINTGITDTAYYWNELSKCVNVYCDLWKLCRTLGHAGHRRWTTHQEQPQLQLRCGLHDRRDRRAYQGHLRGEQGAGTEHLQRVRQSFTVSDSGATFFSIVSPEEAEREGTLEHDRRQFHDHPPGHLGHQQTVHHVAHQQLER